MICIGAHSAKGVLLARRPTDKAKAPKAAAPADMEDVAPVRAAPAPSPFAVAPSEPAIPIQGYVDRISDEGLVVGWAWYPSEPARRVEIEFLVDGDSVGTTMARHVREDVKKAGVGDGFYGFSFVLPWPAIVNKRTAQIVLRDANSFAAICEPLLLRRRTVSLFEERLAQLEQNVRLIRSHLDELTSDRIAQTQPARALFESIGGFFMRLADSAADGGTTPLMGDLRGIVADITSRYRPIALRLPA